MLYSRVFGRPAVRTAAPWEVFPAWPGVGTSAATHASIPACRTPARFRTPRPTASDRARSRRQRWTGSSGTARRRRGLDHDRHGRAVDLCRIHVVGSFRGRSRGGERDPRRAFVRPETFVYRQVNVDDLAIDVKDLFEMHRRDVLGQLGDPDGVCSARRRRARPRGRASVAPRRGRRRARHASDRASARYTVSVEGKRGKQSVRTIVSSAHLAFFGEEEVGRRVTASQAPEPGRLLERILVRKIVRSLDVPTGGLT